MVYLLSIGDYGHYIMNRRWFKEFIGPLCAEGCAFASKGYGFAASPTTKKPGAFPSPMPNEFGVCMVYGRCCTKCDGARQAWVSRHFCRDRWWSPGFLCCFSSWYWIFTFFRKRWGGKGGTIFFFPSLHRIISYAHLETYGVISCKTAGLSCPSTI